MNFLKLEQNVKHTFLNNYSQNISPYKIKQKMSDLIKFTGDSPSPSVTKNERRAKIISTLITVALFVIPIYFILPFAISFVSGVADLLVLSIRVGIMLAGVLFTWWLYKGFRKSIGHWFEKLFSRALDAVISDRPTESMRIEISKAVKNQKEYTVGLSEMIQVVKDMESRELRQNKEALQELDAAAVFKKQAEKAATMDEKTKLMNQATLASNSANNKKTSNDRMRTMKERYGAYVQRMQKLSDSLDFFIKDRTNLCNQLELDWEYAKKMRKSAGLAQENLDLMEDDSIFMRAVRIAEQDIQSSLAYVESAMQNSKTIIDAADLQKGMMNVSSERLLGRYESGEFDEVIQMMNKQSSLDDLKIRAKHEIEGGANTSAQQLQSSNFNELYK